MSVRAIINGNQVSLVVDSIDQIKERN